jgi:hypothetical protein
MILASPLVDWGALVDTLGAAFIAVLVVAVCFGLVVRGSANRVLPLVAIGVIGCVVAAALGVFAMLHK